MRDGINDGGAQALRWALAQCTIANRIKPSNFASSAHIAPLAHPPGVNPVSVHLMAPFSNNSAEWLALPWMDRATGQRYTITTMANLAVHQPGVIRVKTCGDVLDSYRVHAEPKSARSDGAPCGRGTRGLLARRVIHQAGVVYISKESRKLEEVTHGLVHDVREVQRCIVDPARDPWDVELRPKLREIPACELAEAAGITRRAVRLLRNGHTRPKPTTLRRLPAAVESHETADAASAESSVPETQISAGRSTKVGTSATEAAAGPSLSAHSARESWLPLGRCVHISRAFTPTGPLLSYSLTSRSIISSVSAAELSAPLKFARALARDCKQARVGTPSR